MPFLIYYTLFLLNRCITSPPFSINVCIYIYEIPMISIVCFDAEFQIYCVKECNTMLTSYTCKMLRRDQNNSAPLIIKKTIYLTCFSISGNVHKEKRVVIRSIINAEHIIIIYLVIVDVIVACLHGNHLFCIAFFSRPSQI